MGTSTSYLMNNYAPLPVTFSHGKGIYLWDTDGKQYFDALSGIAVCSLGHSHPAVSEAICQQANTLLHTSNLYHIKQQQQLAKKLCQLAQMDNAFFCNSGAEANEAAIKLARLYGHKKNIQNPQIIVTSNSFHGRTLATLTATGNRKVQAGFEPLMPGFIRVDYNDINAINTIIAQPNHNVVAILVEPIQGEGGVNIPDENYLSQLRQLCDAQQWLLILDEIQTGMCRTGKWFAAQHSNVVADIMTVAKALGNGVPIGACLATREAVQLFQAGNHGSTFGGNPLACSAALATIEVMQEEKLDQQATLRGKQLHQGLHAVLADKPYIRNIRSQGLMLGIELTQNSTELVSIALQEGLLINVTAGNTVRLLPPLIVTDTHIEQLIETLSRIIMQFAEH